MSDFKLLIVEDADGDIQVCLDTIKVYNQKHNCNIVPVPCKNKAEAFNFLDNSFDGAIVDIKLQTDSNAGNDVISEICSKFRIPIAIMTATPANADQSHNYIAICKKGEVGYEQILDNLLTVHKTGITRILGGRGEIEKAMNKVFWENILPQLDKWKLHVKEGKQTERALLRFTLNHLMELLDNDTENCLTEEMYIAPPISKNLKTGSIVKKINSSEYYIILSPACDLAIRTDGTCNTDHYLLCKIESFSEIKDKVLYNITSQKEKEKKIAKLLGNNHNNHYHWLPEGHNFPSGIINFRQCVSVAKKDFKNLYSVSITQVSQHFIKDIISRYSSYYARQGQPDFDYGNISKKIVGGSLQ